MKTIKGPGIFLAQFAGDAAPFNTLENMARWAASLGFAGVQIPTWDSRLFDLKQAAESQAYCDDILRSGSRGRTRSDRVVDAPAGAVGGQQPCVRRHAGGLRARGSGSQRAARNGQCSSCAGRRRRAATSGSTAHATFSGALAWPYFYPWPQRPAGLIDETFAELARRWVPILNAFDEAGVDACFELHPGEDLHDGATFERFLAAVDDHPRANILFDPSHMVLQQLDYLAFLDLYHERVRAFHVKDAEFRPNGRSGVYGGYQDWIDRPGRFRSLGDGQVDFHSIFSKMAQYDYPGWAVLEWECCIKHPEQGAAEGAPFIRERIIRVTEKAFDDFAGAGSDRERNRRILGLD